MGSKVGRFAQFAWGVLGYNILVVLWGAYVRATGSGAGCGAHWPLCNGQVVPRSPAFETMVEFSHRLSSGLSLVLVIGLFVWAYRAYARAHPVRTGAALALLFTITEALVGAGLVLLQLVGENTSLARAAWMAVHLVNTFLLLAALALTAWWASGGQRLRWRGHALVTRLLLLVGVVAMLVLGVSGAITALGDTLYPSASLAEGFQADLSPAAHFLVRLRVFHPLIAVVTGLYLSVIARTLHPRAGGRARTLAAGVTMIVVVQLIAGAVNVILLAPVWMQILHLLLADLLWLTFVLFCATLFAEPVPAQAGVRLAPAGSPHPGDSRLAR